MITALTGLVVLSSCMPIAYSQGVSTIVVSKSPVYSGESVTFTCSLAANEVALLSVTIDAMSETQKVGTLFCDPTNIHAFNNPGEGRFSGYRYTGCSTLSIANPHISVSVVASPSLELNYRCTFVMYDSNARIVRNATSTSTRLPVFVLPKAPSLLPSSLVVNEADNLTIDCNSPHGTPAAAIDLDVVQQKRGNRLQNSGSTSVSLRLLGLTKDWHNAKVTCSVVNHNFPNMTARGVIRVNHIAALWDSSPTFSTYSSSQHLDCSAYITSFPGATYRWSVPPGANISESASLNSPALTVQQGTWGLFNCTATNNLTGKVEVITFSVISVWLGPPLWIIVVAVVVPVFIIIIVLLVVLYKCGYFSKLLTRGDRSSTNYNNNRNRDENNYQQEMHDSKSPSKSRTPYAEGDRGSDDDGVVKESLIRGAQPTDDVECSEQSRLKPQLNASDRRLLIAAEGVVANLKHKTLPTTVLVNYPDRSCSLDSILVQVGQAILLSDPPSFKSVALLLRRRKVGLSLSEVDRAVLTSRNVTGESGDQLCDFFARLASMSLNKRASDTRIDILNYGGTDAAQLAKALEDLLKVSVTISGDPFGFGERNSPQAAKQSAVGADYFNRRNVNEVVYADVGVADGPLRSQPIKEGDQVMYSEIARTV